MNVKSWYKENRELAWAIIALLTLSLVTAGVLLTRWYMNKLQKKYFSEDLSGQFVAPDTDQINAALKKVASVYGKDRAKIVEQIFRWETAHFGSGGFKNTNAPGMEAVRLADKSIKPYPYGWVSMKGFWDTNKQYAPIGIWEKPEGGTGIVKPFLILPTVEAAMMTVADWLSTHRPGNWYADNAHSDLQVFYENKISGITPKITNTFA